MLAFDTVPLLGPNEGSFLSFCKLHGHPVGYKYILWLNFHHRENWKLQCFPCWEVELIFCAGISTLCTGCKPLRAANHFPFPQQQQMLSTIIECMCFLCIDSLCSVWFKMSVPRQDRIKESTVKNLECHRLWKIIQKIYWLFLSDVGGSRSSRPQNLSADKIALMLLLALLWTPALIIPHSLDFFIWATTMNIPEIQTLAYPIIVV